MIRGRSEASPVNDRQYRLLVDAITDYAVYMLRDDGRVASWNAGAQRFKGYRSDEIIGQHFSRFYTDEDRAAGLPETALRLARDEGRFENEGWRVRQDGTRFWAHVVIDPIRDPDGVLLGFAKITRDLTERRGAEETLRLSEQQFRLLVQGVTDYAIYMLDPTGRVTNWNSGAERIKGYRPNEIVGEHFSRFYIDEDRAAGLPDTALRTAAAEGRFESEGWRVRKDESRFWAHVVIDPIRSDRGEILGFAKITRDITERMETQRALDLTREALLQSQKLDAIGQLTGGVAHDFNNLLAAVLGSLELLRKRLPADDPKALALLENAVQGGLRGAALTQRMLAFARKQELKLQSIDVPNLVWGMTGLLERSIGPSIELSTYFPIALPPVLSDANQLETALLNLVVNARDAMPDGGRIRIEATMQTIVAAEGAGLAAGDYVRLAVIDTGEGMDAATLNRAAEPFYTTKGIGKGTGLGLSMVHGLAAQSGGRLKLSSTPGEGSQIEIWLAQATTQPSAPAVAAQVDDILGRALVVMTVDDDSLVLANTAAMLEDLGHHAITAVSGIEALRVMEQMMVDVVITDHAMPQMTGLQLAQTIKLAYPAMPVVLATGYAELPPDVDPDMPRLAKPYTQAALATLLRKIHAA